jgi:hypothetical protein
MGKFDAGQGNGRTPERLEASHHRSAWTFDRSMILLNEIVEVLARQEVTQGTCRKQTIDSITMTCARPKSYTDASRDELRAGKKVGT